MNQPGDLAAFPFPLPHDTYRISANVEPAGQRRDTEAGSWGACVLHVDHGYESAVAERAAVLDREPGRFVAAPHSGPAAWDALLYLTDRLATEHPADFALERDGDRRVWHNRRLGVRRTFAVGDDDALGEHPLRFAARQVSEDVVVLGARDDRLWLDAGVVTAASVWSIGFDAGMSFRELHGPVPGNGPGGVFEQAERFLLGLPPGAAYRRLNWGLQADDRRDMSLDAYPSWMPRRQRLDVEDPGREIHLRVEVQHLVRLPLTGSVLFLIDVRLLALERLALVPAWTDRLVSVLRTLPPEVAEYKELDALGELALRYLRPGP